MPGLLPKDPSEFDAEHGAGAFATLALEQYKLYVEMADRISARRATANSYFLTINATLPALAGLGSTLSGSRFFALVPLAGLVLCATWLVLIRSYRRMNTGKFAVIHEMERYVPFAAYDYEWQQLGHGSDDHEAPPDDPPYLQFTIVEQAVPVAFAIIHLGVLFAMVLSNGPQGMV